MPVLSWAPRWPLAAASRREITEAALTSLSAHATVMPSPNPPPSPDPFPSAQLPFYPPTTNPPSVQTLTDLSDDGFIGSHSSLQTHTGLFALPHPVLSSLLETCTTRKISTPPSIVDCFTFCYPSAFSLSASSWFVLLPATSKENQGSQSHRHGI